VSRSKLGLVTIGQTPRPDFEAVFRKYASESEICIMGALDGIPPREIERLAVSNAEYPLHVRLATGAVVDLPMASLFPLVEARARHLAEEGASLIVVLCAGHFPEIACAAPILLPGKVLPSVIGTITRTRQLGIVVPNAGQVSYARENWTADGFRVTVTSASPFRHREIVPAARTLADPTLEMIVLDCMGHGSDYRTEFARRTGRPVVSAQSLVARIAGEFVAGQ